MPTVSPAKIQARQIMKINATDSKTGSAVLELYGGTSVTASIAHLNARTPQVGDYWVVPSEGNPYIAAKSTFQISY